MKIKLTKIQHELKILSLSFFVSVLPFTLISSYTLIIHLMFFYYAMPAYSSSSQRWLLPCSVLIFTGDLGR